MPMSSAPHQGDTSGADLEQILLFLSQGPSCVAAGGQRKAGTPQSALRIAVLELALDFEIITGKRMEGSDGERILKTKQRAARTNQFTAASMISAPSQKQ
ncbi:hypothetical protein CYMTET_14719 [Cymbomonas tetramitiformis]|uniref:Uncharacterized protein n=1 Tax=Cymbomonas tetramitiformis TaxID=36881 RepID=A0AAE0L9W5_9CHLO|nr:hypothetical protein CYMTET_14719 [Cymbomonas tetramitiformis]